MTISEKYQLRAPDIKKWMKNCLVFLAPLVTIYLVFAIENIKVDGFAWADLKPNLVVIGSMFLYVFNVLLDLAKKFIQTNTYK